MKKLNIVKLNVILLALALSTVFTTDASADGRNLFNAKGCAACHGADAKSPILPTYPILAGQSEAYLLQEMKAIESGSRDNSGSPTMQPIVHQVNVDEMKQIAAWLSSDAAVVAGSLFKAKGCATCHGAEGNSPINPVYPILAGQNKDYLLQQMKDIKSGSRSNNMSSAMQPSVHQIDDEQMTRIAEWLSASKSNSGLKKSN